MLDCNFYYCVCMFIQKIMCFFQIMDPKMDSGIVSTYYSVDEAIENGAAPIPLSFDRTIDIQRVIDIMDHFLACEVSLMHLSGE